MFFLSNNVHFLLFHDVYYLLGGRLFFLADVNVHFSSYYLLICLLF